jgi:hypothetical protein
MTYNDLVQSPTPGPVWNVAIGGTTDAERKLGKPYGHSVEYGRRKGQSIFGRHSLSLLLKAYRHGSTAHRGKMAVFYVENYLTDQRY